MGFKSLKTLKTTGTTFFVNSATGTDGATHGTTPDDPVATIDYAVGLCTAGKGDEIYVAPGHTESLSAAGAITCDVAGISIIGLGNGSNRPTITWHNTAATWLISAANVTVKNIRCTVDVDEIVTLFSVSGAGAKLDAVDYVDAGATQAIAFLTTSATADDMEICHCRHFQTTAATATQDWLILTGTDRVYIHDNFFRLALKDAATGATIQSVTTAPLNIEIARNVFYQTGYSANLVSVVLLMSGTTGFVHDNVAYSDQAAIAGTMALASCAGASNFCLNTLNKSGILDPVVDS